VAFSVQFAPKKDRVRVRVSPNANFGVNVRSSDMVLTAPMTSIFWLLPCIFLVLQRAAQEICAPLPFPCATFHPMGLTGTSARRIISALIVLSSLICLRSLIRFNDESLMDKVVAEMAHRMTVHAAAIHPLQEIKIPSYATKNKTLVILTGSIRGGEQTWRTLYRQVLDLNEADLMLVVGHVPPPRKSHLVHVSESQLHFRVSRVR
jgi:hypothetical protein